MTHSLVVLNLVVLIVHVNDLLTAQFRVYSFQERSDVFVRVTLILISDSSSTEE